MDFHVQIHIVTLLLVILSVSQNAYGANILGNETDKLALLDFKSKLTSDPLQAVSSWNDSVHFCQWRGVTCDLNLQRVISLALSGLGLAGTLSPRIGNLSFLETLYLSENLFTSKIPLELGSLTSLKYLNLSFNIFEGEIPPTFSLLQTLTSFGAASNHFSGVFPFPLYNISSLQYLSISQNNFHGDLKEELGLVFPRIQWLLLGGNSFTGRIPASLSNASYLLQLDLSANKFSGSIPFSFGNLRALRYLTVSSNQLTSNDLNFLTPLTNCSLLQTLDISYNQFTGEFPRSIGNLSSQMSYLNFYDNSIHGSIPSEFENLVGLNLLAMSINFLTGNIPASLGKFPNLQALYLGSNQLTGNIPSSLGNLTQLLYLYLFDNSLQGTIPPNFGNFKFLQEVVLSRNRLNGTIPKAFVGLPTLSRTLDLSHNSLTGALPPEVGNLQVLAALDVSFNRLSGDVPNEIGNCIYLSKLSLQSNLFQGTIPNISQLKGLQYLDLSNNNLSGPIPQDLVKLPSLINLNLSFNNFDGDVPLDGVFKNASAVETKGNKNLCGGISQLNLNPCHVGKPRKHQSAALKVILAIVIPSFLLVLVLSTLIFMYLKKRNKKNSTPSTEEMQFHPKITYKELHSATRGFSSENLIGTGNFGRVYRGSLSPTEEDIAVKVLNLDQKGASKSFLAECQALRNIRHRNLVKVLSVCSSSDYQGNDFKALIYQFMPNGSLDRWLHPQEGQSGYARLDIVQRINVAADVASALHYLHYQCPTTVIHCDLKPSNVLLDNDLTAHVSDFGLARLLMEFSGETDVNQFSSLVVKGTIGYTAPEYGMGGAASTCGDVYSYGILLLELFTGKSPVNETFQDGFNLHHYVKRSLPDRVLEIVDQSALKEAAHQGDFKTKTDKWIESLTTVLQIGVTCSAEDPQDRMNMRQVLDKLHSIRKPGPRIRS